MGHRHIYFALEDVNLWMFNSDSFPTSAALVERRALQSAVLCYNGAVHCLCSLCIPLSLPFVTHHLARPPPPPAHAVSVAGPNTPNLGSVSHFRRMGW